ncbi:VanZ family protein [Streptomyces buecherae]|uniref:VanZ family protein n=1 Tax=Streptomyces buecherae TaxID=2763006 RepID=UPI0033F7DA9E
MWHIILYLTPVTVSLTLIGLITAVAAGAWWRSHDPTSALIAARVLLAAWVALVLVATLEGSAPASGSQFHFEMTPAQGAWEPNGRLGAELHPEERDMILRLQIANTLMTLPAGSLAVLAFPRWSRLRALSVCWGVCLAIELAQATGDRVGDIDDVLCNSLGALAGVGLAHVCLHLTRHHRARHRAPRGHAPPRT